MNRPSSTREHQYAIDAANILIRCRKRIHFIVRDQSNNTNLLDLDRTLLSTEQLLHYHILTLLGKDDHDISQMISESQPLSKNNDLSLDSNLQELKTLMQSIEELSTVIKTNNTQHHHKKKKHASITKPTTTSQYQSSRPKIDIDDRIPGGTIGSSSSTTNHNATQSYTTLYSSQRTSALDSLLFRLVVILQLCLVRIEEADDIVSGRHLSSLHEKISCECSTDSAKGFPIGFTDSYIDQDKQKMKLKRRKNHMILIGVTSLSASTTYLLSKEKYVNTFEHKKTYHTVFTIGKVCTLFGTWMLLKNGWRILCMNARLENSILAIEDWQQQWMLIHSVGVGQDVDTYYNEQCTRLLRLIPTRSAKASVWDSLSAIRYAMIKRLMDTLYASVGTALHITKNRGFLMPITTAMAASYYSLVGPGSKSAEIVSSRVDSSHLIQNAWGVVSSPTIKTISLRVSRLLKGAAIAERISICDVTCFILSKDPCPALFAAIKRYRRQKERQISPHLDTILELESFHGEKKTHPRFVNLNDYPKKDIIFHLTAGGFFAHTIAGDVPYLLDWSAETKAVVICPEYALLPDFTFPVAIEEVTRVYVSLVSGDAAPLLGFVPDRVIMTGESTGGNLCAAMCVKLCVDNLIDVDKVNRELQHKRQMQKISGNIDSTTTNVDASNSCDDNISPQTIKSSRQGIHLPHAIMLCCPALNLSLEFSPSRILGTGDPVLPSSLISTISDAYVPEYLGISKTNPLVSPYYASDEILRIFPPTLIFASSEDPLLDDSIHFNSRLRRLGVDCDLFAAQNMPHAYWGLGTAGFPEARHVQKQCQQWMVDKLNQQNNVK